MKLAVLISVLLLFSITPAEQDKYQKDRQQMVKTQLEARGITHKPTLNALRSVERHRLVPKAQVE